MWAGDTPSSCSSACFQDNNIHFHALGRVLSYFISACEEEMGVERKLSKPFLHSAYSGATQVCVYVTCQTDEPQK